MAYKKPDSMEVYVRDLQRFHSQGVIWRLKRTCVLLFTRTTLELDHDKEVDQRYFNYCQPYCAKTFLSLHQKFLIISSTLAGN